MTLKAGDSLQNSKYVVQAVLDQSDFGVTYQVRHILLDQPVLLQTLNDAVQQRGDFAQLSQRFLAGVRSLRQRSDTLRVLDYFEENTLPYVVLQAAPGQTPRLGDWLTLLPEPPTPEHLTQSKLPEVQTSAAQEPEASTVSKPKAVSEDSVISAPQTFPPESVPIQAAPIDAAVPIAPELLREVVLPQINGAAKNGTAKNSTTGQSPQRVPPQRRIPIPLLVTALVGLGLGAGAGFALRFQPTGATGRTPSLFGQDQVFPSQGDWPITEVPNRLSVEPKIEEPLYRTNVPNYYSPTPQPLYSPKTDYSSPSALYPSPEAKSDRPLENSPSPQRSDDLSRPAPQRQAIDSVAIPPLNDFDPVPSVQPSAPPKNSAAANPAPPNLAPSAPRTIPDGPSGKASERSPKLLKPPVVSQ